MLDTKSMTKAQLENVIDNLESWGKHIVNKHTRWGAGVASYVPELCNNLREQLADGNASILETKESVEQAMLNGAESWFGYSYGGCSSIYDEIIAHTLLNQPEYRKWHKTGELPAKYHSRDLLHLQSMALRQASNAICLAYHQMFNI